MYKKRVYRLIDESALARDWDRRVQLEKSVKGPPAHVAENVALSNLELPNPELANAELPNAEPNLNTNQEARTLKIEQRRFHHRCISQ